MAVSSPGPSTAVPQIAGPHIADGEVDERRAGAGPTAHLPALDGLRGVAVLAVVGYHLWPGLVPGGFLGVTVFFVLSGFLITRLLLAEHTSTGTIGLRGFWGRRARRLLPASLMTLTVVAVAWMMQGWLTRAFSADILWSLFDLANWHTLASGSTYGAAGIDSPVLHFWSLAIEEQCYLLLPVLVWGVLRWRGWSSRVLGWVMSGLLVASLTYTMANRSDANLVYLSTFSRAGELLVGVLLAVFVARHGMPTGRWWRLGGPLAAAALVLAALVMTLDDPIFATGGLFVAAVLALVVLVASVDPAAARWLPSGLSVGPLRYVGRISYAVYLFHWPILMAFREAAIDTWWVSPATFVLSLGLAAASMELVEAPIRNLRRSRSAAIEFVGVLAATVVVVCIWGVAPPARDLDFSTAQAQFDALASTDALAAGDAAPADDPDAGRDRPFDGGGARRGPDPSGGDSHGRGRGRRGSTHRDDRRRLDRAHARDRPDLQRRGGRGPRVRQLRLPDHPWRIGPAELRRRPRRQDLPGRPGLRLDEEAAASWPAPRTRRSRSSPAGCSTRSRGRSRPSAAGGTPSTSRPSRTTCARSTKLPSTRS